MSARIALGCHVSADQADGFADSAMHLWLACIYFMSREARKTTPPLHGDDCMKLTLSVLMTIPMATIVGCASQEGVTSTSADGRCTTENTSWAIGKPVDETNGRRLFRQSGAGLWRIVMPKQAVQADHRDDRLTVHVDDSNLITSIACN